MNRDRGQVKIVDVPLERVMRSRAFAAGFADVRLGRAPRYDSFDFARDERDRTNELWNYERGRHFALLCPTSWPLKVDDGLNPKAVALYRAALQRGYVLP